MLFAKSKSLRRNLERGRQKADARSRSEEQATSTEERERETLTAGREERERERRESEGIKRPRNSKTRSVWRPSCSDHIRATSTLSYLLPDISYLSEGSTLRTNDIRSEQGLAIDEDLHDRSSLLTGTFTSDYFDQVYITFDIYISLA